MPADWIMDDAEREALKQCRCGKLLDTIPHTTTCNARGAVVPGIDVYRDLLRKGLVFFTGASDTVDSEMCENVSISFPGQVYSTHEGRALLKATRKAPFMMPDFREFISAPQRLAQS